LERMGYSPSPTLVLVLLTALGVGD
jgi:hypothetical protein